MLNSFKYSREMSAFRMPLDEYSVSGEGYNNLFDL